MIHQFQKDDLNIVLDISSGAIHLVDPLVYGLIGDYDAGKAALLEKYAALYNEATVLEALEEIEALKKAGQLFTPDTYENNIQFKNRKPVIKSMCLHVAHDCNLRCGYCFASQGDYQGSRSLMSAEMGKKALAYLARNSGNHYNLEVDFFGGEPLMNFEAVKEIAAYGRSLEPLYNKRFRYTMTTNGVLLDEEIMDYLNEEMDNVVMSLDGRKSVNDRMRPGLRGEGSYDTIVPKFKAMVAKRGSKDYFIRGTFTRFNLDFAEDAFHYRDLGFKSTSLEPVVTEPQMKYAIQEEDLPKIFSEYERLAEEMIRTHGTPEAFSFFHFNLDLEQGPCIIKRLSGCGAGTEYIAVTPEGDIYPCHQFVGNDEMKMGNILEETWDADISLTFKNAHIYNKPSCRSCWARFYCSGGCHANAYNFNGDITIPYEIGCEMEKKRIETAIYVQARIMTKEEGDHDR